MYLQFNMQGFLNSSQQQSSPARIPRNPSQSSSPNLVHALPPLPPPSFPPSKPTCDSQLHRKMCPSSVPVRRSSLEQNNTANYQNYTTKYQNNTASYQNNTANYQNKTTNFSTKNTEDLQKKERHVWRSCERSDTNTVMDEAITPTNDEMLLTESKVKIPVKSCPECIC